MLQVPTPTKTNWKKILRELNPSDYPSLPEKLKILRDRLRKKEKLSVLDDTVGCALLKRYFEDFKSEINTNYISNIPYENFSARNPLEHQKEAIYFLLKNDRAILADQMGKGKTGSSIYASLSLEESTKILVVAPKSLKYSYANELKIFTDDYYIVDKKWGVAKFVLVHYESLKKYADEIIEFAPNVIICDEAHEVKNMKAGKYKSLNEILKYHYPNKLWLMTGTPIANRPLEFFTLLKLLRHPLSKSWENYIVRYCNGHLDNFGRWAVGGASNLKELHELTKGIILRRINKKGDLPDFKRTPYYLDMSDEVRRRYENSIEDFEKTRKEEIAEELKEQGMSKFAVHYESNTVTKIVVKRIFCAHQKIKDSSVKELINEKLKSDPTNKIIVFTNYIDVVDSIYNEYKEISVKLDGRVKEALDRQNVVDKFNEDPKQRILVSNIRVGGTGYNIQSANIVIINDMDWVPNTMLQAECRVWRYGQKREVEFIYPIYKDSIEDLLYNAVNKKMQIATELIDGTREEYFETDNPEEILDIEDVSKEDILKEIFAQMNI